MEPTRRNLALGIAGLGLLGVLAGGVGLAQAASGPTEPSTPSTTISATRVCPNADTSAGAMMRGAPMTAAANYLGLSLDELRSRLRAGLSLADVAEAQGKSVTGLKNAFMTAMEKRLDANVTLTATQKAQLLERMRSHLDAMISGTGMFSESMMGNGRMGAGMWR